MPSLASDVPSVDPGVPPRGMQRQHLLARFVYSQSRLGTVLRWTAVAMALAVGLKGLLVVLASLLPPSVYQKDLLQEYTLARAVAEGIDPYLPTEVLAARYLGARPVPAFAHPTPHPPPVGILLLPLALFEYSAAAVVWFGIELACVVASVYLLGRLGGSRLPIWAILVISALLLGWYPFYTELAWGQLMVPMLLVLSGALLAFHSGRSMLGGALVGLAILLKPVPLPLLLVFILRKDWRALGGAVLVVLLGYAAAGGVMGLGALERYFTTVLPLVGRGYRAVVKNISTWSLGWRVFDGTGSEILKGTTAPPLVRSPLAAQVVSIGLPSLLLLVACFCVRRQRSLELSFGLMVLVSVLITPVSWYHYLVLAVLPGAQVVSWLASHRFPYKQTNLAIIVAMLLVPDWGKVTLALARSAPVVDGEIRLPFAVALLALMPAVAIGALAWLLTLLGPTDDSTLAAEEKR